MLQWSDGELKQIRDDVFGSCSVMCECSTIEELRTELTYHDYYSGEPKELWVSKRKALESQLMLEGVHCERCHESSCDSRWRHAGAGNITDEYARKKNDEDDADYKAILLGIRTRLDQFFKANNL